MNKAQCLIRLADGSISKKSYYAPDLDDLKRQVTAERAELVQVLGFKAQSRGPQAFSQAELVQFFETASTLLNSGLTLQQSIEIMSLLSHDAKTALAVRSIKADIDKGALFCEALDRALPRLPPLVLGMVRIGERIGSLAAVLNHLLAYLKLMQSMREKMVSASLYPILIVVLATVGVIVLAVFFLPQIENSLASSSGLGATMSAAFGNLRLAIAVFLVLLALPVGTAVAYRLSRRSRPALAMRIEALLYRLPFIGELVSCSQLFSLSYALEVLAGNGVQLDEALQLSAEGSWSVAYRSGLANAAAGIKKGAALSRAIADRSLFPDYFVHWVQIAEQTGRVGQAFGQLRQYYQKELDKRISRVMVLIEPVLISVIGLGLIGVITTVIVPLLGMYTTGGR